MVICLERGADLHMAQLMPLPVWYPLTRVVLVKGPFNVCVCVCVCVLVLQICEALFVFFLLLIYYFKQVCIC